MWWSLSKNSGHQCSGEFPWLAKSYLYVKSHVEAGKVMHPDSGRENNGSSTFSISLDSIYVLLPLPDSNLYLSPVISHNHEYNSFQWVPWVLSTVVLGTPWTCSWYQKWGWSLVGTVPSNFVVSLNPLQHPSLHYLIIPSHLTLGPTVWYALTVMFKQTRICPLVLLSSAIIIKTMCTC